MSTLQYHFKLAKVIAVAHHNQCNISREVLKQIKAGGVGHVPDDKGSETAHFIFENYNSLAP